MEAVKPKYKILYNKKNVTADLSEFLISLRYTDKVHGESDEIELTFENLDSIWLTKEWYPEKGDTVEAQVGYDGDMIDCGLFEVDEVSGAFNPDTFTIRALATGIKEKPFKTKRSKAHENKTLKQIADETAKLHGLTVLGTIRNLKVKRITQYREHDLAFITRLASNYGYVVSVRGKKLVFQDVYKLEEKDSKLTLSKADISALSFTDHVSETYTKAKTKYQSQNDEKLVEAEASDSKAKSFDILEIRTKAEDKQQAMEITKAWLHRKNTMAKEATMTVEGKTALVAGNNVRLKDIGVLSGIWHVISSDHSVSRSGYVTSVNLKYLRS